MQDLQLFIRSQVQKMILEAEEDSSPGEETTGAGKGGWKGEIKQAENLAVQDPKLLLKRLEIRGVTGGSDINKLFDLLEEAVSNADAMKAVFEQPVGKQLS